jgi:hypothetical protein
MYHLSQEEQVFLEQRCVEIVSALDALQKNQT